MLAGVSRIRVAAYVLRERGSWQLLVFEQSAHPDAGLQIPAGGVRPDECLPDAVLREVGEETGLVGLTIRGQLHTENAPHPISGGLRTTRYFVVDAPPDTPDAWTHRVHGDGFDSEMIFHCRFESLPLQHPLADNQDAGLGLVHPTFTTTSRR
ncbi:NUDIX domain-containing protein [Mycobacterium sp. AMU20-3851]|uniref:NUDIX domain-containing protein n=1 Tax=Mycobacterium sp. AMU20-3851 TaxID=3122055 RepID=UPI003754C569